MEAWLSDSVLREENEVIEKKIQGYAQRMSELETALVDEGKEEESLKQQDEALVQQRSLLLQKQTVVEKRVYGSFLEEVGVASVQELESEYMAKLRENESMQTECRTHITLIESKREYNTQRLQAIAQSVKEYEEREGGSEGAGGAEPSERCKWRDERAGGRGGAGKKGDRAGAEEHSGHRDCHSGDRRSHPQRSRGRRMRA